MTPAARLDRPLQRRCAQCRRVQEVRLPALYHVVVPNKGGGTRRDGGYDCRYCGAANPIPANEMPLGLVASLPSHAELLAAKAAAAARVAEVTEIEAPDIEAPAAVPVPPAKAPVPAARPAKRIAPPAWVAGKPALAVLDAAVRRAADADDGFCTAFVRGSDGGLSTIDVRARIADADIPDWLDRIGCELLVVGGTGGDGARWKAIFHPLAGAATLAVDPAGD